MNVAKFTIMNELSGHLLITFFFLLASLAVGNADKAQPIETKRYNVLFIAVDDLRPEFGAYGADQIVSPSLDKLAEESLLFNRAYCQQAVCNPSRASLMTGLRPDSTKVWDLQTHFRETVPDVETIGQYFKKNGYHVAGMGKIFHGHLHDELTWSVPFKIFGGWPPYNSEANLETYHRLRKEHRKSGKPGWGLVGPAVGAPDIEDSEHEDGKMVDYAVEMLADIKEPFFLAVGFGKPHLPFVAPKKYWDLYDGDAIELPANYYREPVAGIPPQFRNFWSGEMAMYEVPETQMINNTRIFPEDFAKELIHGYYACVSFVDEQIGCLLAGLEAEGLVDDTIVILWGDHGFHLGDHGTWTKHTNFEVATRSPLIFRVPGANSAGSKTDALVEFVDIYPTLAEVCGLPVPEHCEGTSFLPLVNKPNLEWKDAAFSQYPFRHESVNYMGYSIRTDRYRYTEHQRLDGSNVVDYRELYDLSKDPAENTNLAAEPDYTELIAELSSKLNVGWSVVATQLKE